MPVLSSFLHPPSSRERLHRAAAAKFRHIQTLPRVAMGAGLLHGYWQRSAQLAAEFPWAEGNFRTATRSEGAIWIRLMHAHPPLH